METQLTRELQGILRAIIIHSQDEFSFAGQRVPVAKLPPPQAAPYQMLANDENPLISGLKLYLYQYCYTSHFTGTMPVEPAPVDLANPQNDMTETLSAANASREHWESGWQIQRIEAAGQILAQRHGLSRMVWPGQFLMESGLGGPPQIGMMVNVFSPREARAMMPGFYMVYGETVSDLADDQHLVRTYWNIRSDGAPLLLRQISQAFNRYFVPFQFKCLNQPALYTRADAAVLYVAKRYHQITSQLIAEILPHVAPYMKPETPLFAKILAPGLSLAEDPHNGESFGMHRCRLLAEGIWDAYRQGLQTEPARMEAVAQRFQQNGISLTHPYLNAGAVDCYGLNGWRKDS